MKEYTVSHFISSIIFKKIQTISSRHLRHDSIFPWIIFDEKITKHLTKSQIKKSQIHPYLINDTHFHSLFTADYAWLSIQTVLYYNNCQEKGFTHCTLVTHTHISSFVSIKYWHRTLWLFPWLIFSSVLSLRPLFYCLYYKGKKTTTSNTINDDFIQLRIKLTYNPVLQLPQLHILNFLGYQLRRIYIIEFLKYKSNHNLYSL